MDKRRFSFSDGSGAASEASRFIGSRRVIVAGLLLSALLALLLYRLFYLQVITHSENALQSNENRIQILPVPPTRGEILDRNGKKLAHNVAMLDLAIVPDQIQDMPSLLNELSEIIPINDEEIKQFQESVKRGSKFSRHVIKEGLTDEQVARLAVERHRLDGVVIEAGLRREYIAPEPSTHILGRVGRIAVDDIEEVDALRYRGLQHIGKSGVELSMEDALVGFAGNKRVETNAHGRILRTLSVDAAQAGDTVYLTIDSDLQKVAYDALGDFNGSAVVMDPSTGQILAMVSKPSYDPNQLVGRSTGESYGQLLNDARTPLINRAIQSTYSPGSVLKVFLGIAVDEHYGNSEKIFCPGYYTLPGHSKRYRCWKRQGHGWMDLHQAIVESCDVFFYELARRLGIEEMHYRLARFGLGEATQVNLRNEKAGLLPSPDWKRYVKGEPWYEGETVIFGIGQGFTLTTMIQLAQATSIVANRGERFKPQIVLKTEDFEVGEVRHIHPKKLSPVQVDSSKAYEIVIDAMVDVVHSKKGTAYYAMQGIDYTAAGKTGTVQVISVPQDVEWDPDEYERRFHPHGVFVSFAPVDDPRVVVAVIAENSDGATKVAVPAARQIMDYVLAAHADERPATQGEGG